MDRRDFIKRMAVAVCAGSTFDVTETPGKFAIPPMTDCVAFSRDGSKIYVMQSYNLVQYDLSTSWDVSTASFNGVWP